METRHLILSTHLHGRTEKDPMEGSSCSELAFIFSNGRPEAGFSCIEERLLQDSRLEDSLCPQKSSSEGGTD